MVNKQKFERKVVTTICGRLDFTDGEYFVTVEDKDNSETYSLNDILVEMEGNIINLTSDTKE